MSENITRVQYLASTLDRPLVFLSTKATGLDPALDRVVEMAIAIFSPDGDIDKKEYFFNPQKPLLKTTCEFLDVSNSLLQEAPLFKDNAQELSQLLNDCYVAGANVKSHLVFLKEEFQRAGISIPLERLPILDVMGIYSNFEGKGFNNAKEFFLGESAQVNARSSDLIEDTVRVLDAEIEKYSIPIQIDQLLTFSQTYEDYTAQLNQRNAKRLHEQIRSLKEESLLLIAERVVDMKTENEFTQYCDKHNVKLSYNPSVNALELEKEGFKKTIPEELLAKSKINFTILPSKSRGI
ncbi:MAG: 3'-5' exonuclease [Sediminibacterium sp.]|jgi:hypothetical protein|nr:3'-5' exonuclease [Sediminibacterium sp.]